MALCSECLPPDVNVTQKQISARQALPTLADVKSGLREALDESKELITQARTWVKNDMKTYTNTKNWNIKFDKTGSLRLAKDTAIAILPLIIIGFIAAKILLAKIPFSGTLPAGEISKAAALWILNLAMGVGISLSASASAGFVSASGGGTVRIIASGLTLLLAYLLIRKSRARAAEGTFTLNPQTEILGTAAFLSIASFLLTALTGNSFSKGLDLNDIPINGSISISVDFYSLFIGPLIISVIVVLLGSYAVNNQKKISEILSQTLAFFLGATALVALVVLVVAIRDRQFSYIPIFLATGPTLMLVTLVGGSGVPLLNTAGDKVITLMRSSNGTPVDISHPNLTLALYLVIVLAAIALVGAIAGFRVDPRIYTVRTTTRIILSITGVTLFLNFFLMFYAFGSGSAAFGLASGSQSIAVFAHPLYLIPASLLWGLVYLVGARHLTPHLAERVPFVAEQVLPRLRITMSGYYQGSIASLEDLTPLEKQTRAMQAEKVKAIAKKVALVGVALFIVAGPANNFIANRISSPESTVTAFFDALENNDASSALSNISELEADAPQDGLTDEVLKQYSEKMTSLRIERLNETSDPNYRTVTVSYLLGGSKQEDTLSLFRDTTQKKFKIFPVWKLRSDFMQTYTFGSKASNLTKIGNYQFPPKLSYVYLFPGRAKISYEDPLLTNNYTITYSLDGTGGQISDMASAWKPEAQTYIEKMARADVTRCNQEVPLSENCPQFTTNGTLITEQTLSPVLDLTISNLYPSESGYTFSISFNGTITYLHPITGVKYSEKYYVDRTAYLSSMDSFASIDWNN
jgi:hypothetical protein